MPLREGRALRDDDSERAPLVVVVNEAMARRLWPGERPLGQRIRFLNDADYGGRERWHEVVGVVGDVKSRSLAADEEPAVYVSFAQRVLPFVRGVSLVLRTSVPPESLLPAVRRALVSVDPDLPVFEARGLEKVVARSVAGRRFNALLLEGFAVLALVLSAIGVYGVLSEAVGRRTREIGIRMALGAQRAEVLRLVLREGMALVLAGLGLGLPASLLLSRTLRGFLFGIAPGDPQTLAAVSLLLFAAALLAAYLPARRATQVEPVTALRSE
jgi:putative ABC transport system permease protein